MTIQPKNRERLKLFLTEANVKDIAVKAIENASKVWMFSTKPEKEDN